MTTTPQHRAIHALKKTLRLTDDDYRAMMSDVTGRTSAKDLATAQAEQLILHMKGLAGQSAGAPIPTMRRPTRTVSGKFGKVLQALWLSAYNLGIVDNRDDAALLAFVERQTGQSHTRFLVDPAEARKAIEGLKGWIARESGVEWHRDAAISKQRVCMAIHNKLAAFDPGAPRTFHDWEPIGADHGLPLSFDAYGDRDFDKLATTMGAHLRKARAIHDKKRRAA